MTKKTFVGFGFGPIQSGLFLLEAQAGGNFGRFVIAEVDKALVAAVRANGGRVTVNVAHKDRVQQRVLEGVELYDPADPADRETLLDAIAASDELATSLPSVKFYDMGQTSVAANIAAGLARRKSPKPTIMYTAENNNHANEILEQALLKHAAPMSLEGVQVLNTVIGKMSGVIVEPDVMARLGLATMTPATEKAVLVEAFNRILISRIALPGFRRGIECFIEKTDLVPFEEAKLFGHNAIHAMMAYLADARALTVMSQTADDPWIMAKARQAFLDESGAALVRKYSHLGDPLFTPAGYEAYADDLLERIVCPFLNDLVERVGRDHLRKLAYDDRLYGTMYLALEQGITPTALALGAAAGVRSLIARQATIRPLPPDLPKTADELTPASLRSVLTWLWRDKTGPHADTMIELTWQAMASLR